MAERLGVGCRRLPDRPRRAVYVAYRGQHGARGFRQLVSGGLAGLVSLAEFAVGSYRRHRAAEQPQVRPHHRLTRCRRPVKVRLLLPAHFQAEPKRRWPALYLLHGCCDSYISWTRSTDIERLTSKLDLLVVMPDGGQVGFYSNWRTGPQWETFHTQELPQLLATPYRANGKAAIAGVSMGGSGRS